MGTLVRVPLIFKKGAPDEHRMRDAYKNEVRTKTLNALKNAADRICQYCQEIVSHSVRKARKQNS